MEKVRGMLLNFLYSAKVSLRWRFDGLMKYVSLIRIDRLFLAFLWRWIIYLTFEVEGTGNLLSNIEKEQENVIFNS